MVERADQVGGVGVAVDLRGGGGQVEHGGIRPTQHIAKIAEAAGIPCTIGSNLEREIATAAMAHVTVCTANIQFERFPGDLIGPVYYEAPLTRTPLRYQADRLWVPEGPGLGVAV